MDLAFGSTTVGNKLFFPPPSHKVIISIKICSQLHAAFSSVRRYVYVAIAIDASIIILKSVEFFPEELLGGWENYTALIAEWLYVHGEIFDYVSSCWQNKEKLKKGTIIGLHSATKE